MSFIAVLNTDSGSFEIQEEQIYPIQIPSAGNWTFKAQANDVLLSVSNQESGANSMSFGNKFTISIDAPQTLYVKYSSPLQGLKTANILYNNYIAQGGGGSGSGGGGGGASSGQAPILVENGVIKLLVTNEFLVNEANQLALALNNNEVIKQIISQINSLKGTLEYVGQIPNSNQEVKTNSQLLTDFVQSEQGRAPQAGDIIITNDTPAYSWIYASNKGAGGEVTSHTWKSLGNTGISIATNTTLGIVKGSTEAGKVDVAVDGTMTVNNAVLTSGAQTIGGTKTFSNAVTFNSDILLTNRLNFQGNLSIAPSTNEVLTIHLANGAIGTNCYANLDFENKGKIINLVNPTNPHDASNKAYVDSQIASQANALILGAEAPTTDNVPQGKLALYIQPQS